MTCNVIPLWTPYLCVSQELGLNVQAQSADHMGK